MHRHQPPYHRERQPEALMARGLVKHVSAIAAMLALAAAICAPVAAADLVRTIKVDGIERTYRLHVPPGGKSSAPMALVMVLHGGGGSGSTTDKHTHFSAEADK